MFEEKLKTTKRNLYFLLIAKCLLLSWTVFAQVFNLSSETQITQAQIEAIRNALPRLENDKVFYHWTNIGNGVRWVGDGKVDPGEIAFMNTPTGDRQVYGPGLYLADDPVSSSSFGSLPTSFKISKGTPVYNRDVVLRVLNKKLSNEEASKLGEYIPFVRETDNPGWFVTNSAQNTQDVKYAAYYSPKTVIRDDNLKDSFEVISKLRDNASGGDAEYLKNLVASFEYMDGISVPAAMKTNPEAPWKAFSPEGLDAFERTMNPGFVKWANSSPPVGTNAQIEKLTKIYASLSGGEVKSLDQIVRSEGIRAGGDELGQKFLATEKQLKELLNNPYLEVISEKRSDGLYLVHYFYPDAFHYKNLKEKLSPELFARLSKMNPDELMKNHELRKSLNKEIIQDLLKNLFDHYSGRIPAVSSTDYLEFQRFLISIHPFDDYNGRSVRMFARLQPGGENLHYFFSDMDLLTPIEEQKVMLGDSSEAIVDMRRSLFHEYLKAKSENRMPDYLKTGAFESYMFEAGPEQTYFDYTNKDVVQDIQKRNWPQVFKRAERDHKKNFSYLIAKSSDLPLKHARLKRFFQNAFADKELLRTHIDDYLNFLKLLKNGGEGWAEGDLERLIYVANGTFIKEPTLFTALPKNKQKAVLDLYQNYLTRSLKNHLEGKGATSFYANYDVFYQYYDSFYQEASSEAKLKSIPPSKLKEITEKQLEQYIERNPSKVPSNTRFTSLFGQKVFDETYLKNNPQVYKKLSSLVVGQKLTKDDAFAQLFERVHYILARSPDIVKAYPEADQKYILNFLQDRLRGYYGLNNGSIAVGDFDEYAEFNAYERLLENSSPDLKNKMMTPEMIRAERRELVYNQFFKNPDDLLGRLEFKEMLEGMFFDPSFVEKHPEFYSKLLELADKSNRTILDLKELLNGTNKALLDNPETLQKLPEKLRNDMLDFYEKRLSGYVKYVDKKLVVKDINYSEELRLYENLYKNSSPTMKKTVLSYQEVKNKLHTSLDEILKNVPSPQERTALFKDSIELFDPEQKIKIYEMVFLGDADYIASQITDWPHPWDNYFRMLKGDKSPDVLVDFIKEFEMMMGKISSMDEVYKGKYALPDYKYINRFYSEMYTSLPETHRQLVTLPEDFAQGLRRSIAKVMISKQGIKDASRLQESLRVYLSTAPSKIELLTDFYPTVLKASGGNAEVKKNALTPISQLYREISVDQFTNLPNAKKEEFVKSIKFLRDSALADDGLSGFLTSFVPSTDDWSKKFGDDFNKILNAQISAPSPSDCVTPILKSILN